MLRQALEPTRRLGVTFHSPSTDAELLVEIERVHSDPKIGRGSTATAKSSILRSLLVNQTTRMCSSSINVWQSMVAAGPDSVADIGGLQCLEHLEQGRLVQ